MQSETEIKYNMAVDGGGPSRMLFNLYVGPLDNLICSKGTNVYMHAYHIQLNFWPCGEFYISFLIEQCMKLILEWIGTHCLNLNAHRT